MYRVQRKILVHGIYEGAARLRWHASIDDETSCASIMRSMSELKNRIYNL